MKFIDTKGAPDIPIEILDAQESGKLVFFCGAGISYKAGLPLFKGLVEKVYQELHPDKDKLECKLIKNGSYDRALHLLEKHVDRVRVRKAIIDQLSLKPESDLSLYRAILNLSKTKENTYRLVTTNVDEGFQKVIDETQGKPIIDAAPKLPFPAPQWNSIVHLHGIINTHDPHGENLVFTSGDFGSAYLTEQWASRFVTELLRHFTVLFVGYSVNDPILRYMMDSIAAERIRKSHDFHRPYIIINTSPTKEVLSKKHWESMGITPIFYFNRRSNLYETLYEWEKYSLGGLDEKNRLIATEVIKPPLPPYKNTAAQRVIDILKEKTTPDHPEITGVPARTFKEIPACIEWLEVLHINKLLTRKFSCAPLSEENHQHNNTIPNYLWEWLTLHLESEGLVDWVIKHRGYLDSQFKKLIQRELLKKKLKEPYLIFWRILISDHFKCKSPLDIKSWSILEEAKQSIDDLSLNNIISILQPYFVIQNYSYKSEAFELSNIFEVVIDYPETYEEIIKLRENPEKFIRLLLPVTHALNKALELWEIISPKDHNNNISDRSCWDLVSISPSDQERYKAWAILIELCRDLWECAWDNDRKLAITVLNLWKLFKYPTFRRLAFHAYTYKQPYESSDEALNYLLEDDNHWLWAEKTKREKFRLLAYIWPKLSESSAEKLLQTISVNSPNSSNNIPSYSVWLLLAKLRTFERNADSPAELKLTKLCIENKKDPAWRLSEGEEDEFVRYLKTSWGFDSDISLDKMDELPIPDLVKELREDNPIFKKYLQVREGRIYNFLQLCKDKPEKAFSVLHYACENSIWDKEIWFAGLTGLADSQNPHWEPLANLLQNASDILFTNSIRDIALWTKKAVKDINSQSEKYFWKIADKLFQSLSNNSEEFEVNDESDIVSYAINHPAGILTEALMNLFNQRKLNSGDGIPDMNYFNILNQIVLGKEDFYKYGRVILASRLYYLYIIDPKWTKENLLSKFNWESSPREAISMWKGYLWSPGMSLDLASLLKNNLPATLTMRNVFSDKDNRQLHNLFAFVCFEYPHLYSYNEQREALKSIGLIGIENIANFISLSIPNDQSKSGVYWQNRLKPFITNVWPKEENCITENTSLSFALVIIKLAAVSEDAFKKFSHYIKPFRKLYIFILRLNQTDILRGKSQVAVDLLYDVIPFEEAPELLHGELKKAVNELRTALPCINKDPKFNRISNYQLQYDQ